MDTIISWMLVAMLATQVAIILVAGKLWRVHYPSHRFSHVWFIVLVELLWWGHFFLQLLVVA